MWKALLMLGIVSGLVLSVSAQEPRIEVAQAKGWNGAVALSPFGERPAFSPDGTRIAFVGKTMGDAYEIDLRTRRTRNLTAHLGRRTILRVQYLPNGDYLITAPRDAVGPGSRAAAELWVLDKDRNHGLVPLDQAVSEGTAVSRLRNRIAYTVPASPFDPAHPLKSRFFTANIAYRDGVPRLTDRREIEPSAPCDGETQDFRVDDTELTVSCYAWPDARHGFGAGAYGITLETGALHRYRDIETEYNEIEGVSPDGRWSAVECSARAGGEANVGLADVMKNPARFLKPIDICRLEMKPDGARTMLFRATQPGSTRKANNPVVSPDGKWVAFASSDASANDVGTGDGIYLFRIPG